MTVLGETLGISCQAAWERFSSVRAGLPLSRFSIYSSRGEISEGTFLTERLVVDKGPRQRRIEGILYFVLPPTVGLLCWHYLGWGLWQIPAIVLAFIIMSLMGTAIAVRLGGELITPVERWRRNMERLAKYSLWSMLFWLFVFYALLFVGMVAPMTPPDVPSEAVRFIFVTSVSGAAVGSVFCTFYLRSKMSAGEKSPEPVAAPDAPWPWLARSLPFRVIGLIGLIASYWVAQRFSGATALFVLLAGTWLTSAIESAIKNRSLKAAPVLWNNFSFSAALAAGALLYGIYFGLFCGLTDSLALRPDEGVVHAALAAATGFAIGILLALIPWAVAHLNTVKPRTETPD